jgi:hypothetical protein
MRLRIAQEGLAVQAAEERLQFVVHFAGMDLNRLRAGDWLNLREDLAAFLASDLVLAVDTPPQEYSADDFRALQQEVQQLLRGLVSKREPSGSHWPLSTYTELFDLPGIKYGLTPLDTLGSPGRNMPRVKGPTREVFVYVLFQLLWQEGTERILQCPECQTIFYRNRHQLYCTRRCVNRANQRSWRAGKRQPI